MDDSEFLMSMRTAFLNLVDAIERKLNVSPRTAELRQMYKGSLKRAPTQNEVDDGCSDERAYKT